VPKCRLQFAHTLEGKCVLIGRAAHRLQVNMFISAYRGSLIYLIAFGCHFPLLLRHAFGRSADWPKLIR